MWKSRAEEYQRKYDQAVRDNKEMTSAVGQLTQAASERGGETSELQQRNIVLQREQERTKQELKMAELEKEDFQKQLENLQSSCSYFQNKYQSSSDELMNAQKEHAVTTEVLKRECEGLKSQTRLLRQQLEHVALQGVEGVNQALETQMEHSCLGRTPRGNR